MVSWVSSLGFRVSTRNAKNPRPPRHPPGGKPPAGAPVVLTGARRNMKARDPCLGTGLSELQGSEGFTPGARFTYSLAGIHCPELVGRTHHKAICRVLGIGLRFQGGGDPSGCPQS